MPNTLVHIAVQGPLTQKLSRSFFAWMLLGCILPDLPWIGMHLIQPLDLFNPYKLRLYFTAQASLFFCLFLSGAIALFLKQSGTVFLIIAGNSLLHLLLDSVQIKWGNGVNLIAPFDWHLFSMQLIWPDTVITTTLTVLGLIYFLFAWKGATSAVKDQYRLEFPQGKKLFFTLLLAFAYFTMPLLFFPAMQSANTYHLNTMLHPDTRTGQPIAFDRAYYDVGEKEIEIYSGERIAVVGKQPNQSGRVSFLGTFIAPDTIRTEQYHFHRSFRDLASQTGLLLTCVFLFNSLLLPGFRRTFTTNLYPRNTL